MSSGPIQTTITPREIAAYFDLEACNAFLNLKKRDDSNNQDRREGASEIGGISPLHNQQGTQFEVE